MIKKKLSILLSLSLAVLFISLLDTTSYAYNYRITEEDCDTLINKVVTSSYDWKSTAKSRLKTMVNNVYNNGWDTCVISLNNQNYFDIAVYGFNASSVTSVKDSKNVNYMGVNTSNTTNIRYYCSKSGTSMSSISSSTWQNYSTFGSGAQKRSAYLVVPNDLGADGTLFSGPWQSNDYLVFSPPDYFTFLLSPSIPTITINGDSVPYFNLNSNTANDFYLGVLGLAENYYDSELFEYRYYQGKWKLNKITKIQDIGEVEQNLISVTIKGRYLASNTLYSLQMNPDPDSEFAPYSQPFFMKDRHTSITNGALDLENTFSGDYYNNYNNDTNTDKIIDNDQSLYDKMFTVSGEQMQQILDNTIAQINIPSGELEEIDMIFNYLNREPRRFCNIMGKLQPKFNNKRNSNSKWRQTIYKCKCDKLFRTRKKQPNTSNSNVLGKINNKYRNI